MKKARTLKQKIEYRMARQAGDDVFLPREFSDLSGQDQVPRALRMLVKDGRLIRLGYGVYARARRSRLSGRPMVDSASGFSSAALQASTKLGVPWELSATVLAFNEDRSTQIPVNPAVKVNEVGFFSRLRRSPDLDLGRGVTRRPNLTHGPVEHLSEVSCVSGLEGANDHVPLSPCGPQWAMTKFYRGQAFLSTRSHSVSFAGGLRTCLCGQPQSDKR